MDSALLKVVAAGLSLLLGVFQFFRDTNRGTIPVASFERVKADQRFYTGEGWVDIQDDLGKAKTQAKARALQDLSQNIQVQVETSVQEILGSEATPAGPFQSQIKAYTSLITTHIDKEVCALDIPKKGQLSCLVAVSRQAYQDKIRQRLEAKRDAVLAYVQSGQEAQEALNISDALSYFSLAQAALTEEWGENGGGALRQVVMESQNQLASALSLQPLSDAISFTDKGVPQKKVQIQVGYANKGKTVPLDGVSLTAAFIQSRGRVDETVRSKNNGVASFRVRYIDPYKKKARLRVRMKDLESVFCDVLFTKVKPLALKVTAEPGSYLKRVAGFQKRLASSLSDSGFQVFPLNADDPFSDQIQIEKSHYLLSVRLQLQSTKHPEVDLFQATGRSFISLESLEEERSVFQEPGPSKETYGASPRRAVHAALDQLEPGLLKTIKKKMKRVEK